MITYKLYIREFETVADAVLKIDSEGSSASFILGLNNPEEQTFKKDLANGAELQDADGNTMTAAEAKEFVATLP